MEQQLAATARVRQKLMQWSDDDEEHSVPRKAAHVSSSSSEEEEEEEQQERESSPESSPVRNRKRGSIAACLDSDDEDIPLPAGKETHRKLSPPPTKRKISSSSPGVLASSIPSSSSSPSARRVFFSPPPAPVAPSPPVPAGAAMQSAIQPGCTQLSSCKRRFLAYNMLGSISSCESDGFSHVEVHTNICTLIPLTGLQIWLLQTCHRRHVVVECKVSSASPRATDSLQEERDTLS